VPPVGILSGWKRAKPYVYSDAEIDALLAAALALPPEDGLRRWTYHALFGLIAVTGMRLSEAMALERDDVDLDAGVLTVRLTKFGKSRLVPLHPTTSAALRIYANRRDAHLGSRCGSTFFVAEQGGRLLHQYVHRVFWRLSREIGLRRPDDRTGPRVHDFRHRFAIRTLLAGIAKARTSSSNFRCSPPTSATPACATPIGISRPVSTGTEVSPNVGFQNSLIRRVWYRSVISRRCDRIVPLRVDGRGVWVLPAAL
jgi:integrase